jgi:Holliday junction DNA helicase RuvB
VSSDVNQVKPTSLNHLIGQCAVIDQVKTALDAAFEDKTRFEHSLLVGPPGLGKSQLASVIADEMAVDFEEVLGQSIVGTVDLNGLLMSAESKDILHIDEAHELDKSVQTALYLALDKRQLFVRGRNTPNGVPIADFTLLLSTTDEYALLQPLRDRMRLTLRFDFYSEAELVVLLRQRAHALGWEISQELLPILAQRSRGTPRIALRLLQACRRVCRAHGQDTIALQHWQRACQLEQIDDLGLGPMERQYLAILAEGPARLNMIATVLGLPTRTVSQVTEQYLVRAGLIDKDKNGVRQLTGKGLEHIRRGQDE